MKTMELRPNTGLILGFTELVNAGVLTDTPAMLRAYFDSTVVVDDMQLEMSQRDPDGSITRLLNECHRRYLLMLKPRSEFEVVSSYLEWIKHRERFDRTAPVLDDTMSPALQRDDTVAINHWLPEDGEAVAFQHPNDARVRFGYFRGDRIEGPDGSTIVPTDEVKIVGVAVTVIGRLIKPRVTEQN